MAPRPWTTYGPAPPPVGMDDAATAWARARTACLSSRRAPRAALAALGPLGIWCRFPPGSSATGRGVRMATPRGASTPICCGCVRSVSGCAPRSRPARCAGRPARSSPAVASRRPRCSWRQTRKRCSTSCPATSRPADDGLDRPRRHRVRLVLVIALLATSVITTLGLMLALATTVETEIAANAHAAVQALAACGSGRRARRPPSWRRWRRGTCAGRRGHRCVLRRRPRRAARRRDDNRSRWRDGVAACGGAFVRRPVAGRDDGRQALGQQQPAVDRLCIGCGGDVARGRRARAAGLRCGVGGGRSGGERRRPAAGRRPAGGRRAQSRESGPRCDWPAGGRLGRARQPARAGSGGGAGRPAPRTPAFASVSGARCAAPCRRFGQRRRGCSSGGGRPKQEKRCVS